MSSDAAGDLLRAVIALLQGWETARCVWEDEPGQYRWLFHRRDDLVDIRILRFGVTFSTAQDEDGATVFITMQPLSKFAQKVYSALRRILREVGAEEYERPWGQAFPQAPYDTLRDLLRERRRRERG